MRLRLVLAALLVALTAAAGCGGGDDDESAAPTTAATSQEATTTEPATTETAEAEPGPSAATLVAAGRDTAAAGSSRVSVSASVGGRSFTAEGAYDYDADTGEMTLDLGSLGGGAGPGEIELVFDEPVIYYRLPPGSLPMGKEWVKIDLKALGDVSGIDLQQLAQGNQTDPGQYLQWLEAVGGEIEVVGSEEVRGAETTHYRATVDLDQVVETAAPEVRDATRVWIDILKRQLDLGEIPIDVWVDEEGLVRRIRQEYELGNVETEITMELYDFGVEVDPEVPSPDEVVDLGKLVGQL